MAAALGFINLSDKTEKEQENDIKDRIKKAKKVEKKSKNLDVKIQKIKMTKIKPYFAGIVMDKIQWKARIDDTDIAKLESKINKKEKSKTTKKQRKKRVKDIDPNFLRPTQFDEVFKLVCGECNHGPFLIQGWGEYGQILYDFRGYEPAGTADENATPAWGKYRLVHKPAGFSTLPPKK